MAGIELSCVGILSLWLLLRFARERQRAALAMRLLCVAGAAWLGEESCIRLYGFYCYAVGWHAWLLDVPLAIICIWPVVIQSALDLSRAATGWRRAALAAGLVVVDAGLIEPIATASHLWTWLEPGPFSVPILGVLGWGFFTLGVALVVERRAWLALLVGPALTHLLLLASWWGAFRWLPATEDPRLFVAAALLGSLAVALRLWRRPPAVARRDVLLRAPAAAFFFVLLALFAREHGWLVAWALSFAPPWLVLLASVRRAQPSTATAASTAAASTAAMAAVRRIRRAALAPIAVAVLVLGTWSALGERALVPLVAPAVREVAIDEPLADDERSLVLVGDVMLGRGVAGRAERERIPFATFFDDTRPLLVGADLAFANLEAPLSERGKEKPLPIAFRAPPEAALGLVSAGIDVVSLANNHALDFGPVALDDTGAHLRAQGIEAVGVGRAEEAQTPIILDARGVTVGFLAYCDPRSAGGCSFLDGPHPDKPYRALRATLERDVRALRPRVDLLVVSMHWGIEEHTEANARQVELGHWLIDLGVDVVAGHHPHAQQPVERYGRGVIFYSMGNFVFDQHSLPQFLESRLHRVVFGKDGVRRVAWLPLRYEKRRWQPRPVAERMVAVDAPLHGVLGARGSVSSNETPPASRSRTPMRPPWRSATSRQK